MADGNPSSRPDDGRTVWIGDIPIALAQPSGADGSPRAESVRLSRDEGQIAGFAGQRIVTLLAEKFGPVERAVVRLKAETQILTRGDRRLRDRRSWALVTFKNEQDADGCLSWRDDGILVPETLPVRPSTEKVPVKVRPGNIAGELAKGHRGALTQVAEKDAVEAMIVTRNVMKRPTLKEAGRAVIMMRRTALAFREGNSAPAAAAAGAPTARGRSDRVQWIVEDPCGMAVGPQAWTQRNNSRHRTMRNGPGIKLPRRTVYDTPAPICPTQLRGVPRGKAVKKQSRKLRETLSAPGEAHWAEMAQEADGKTHFQLLWDQLNNNGWRARIIKRMRVNKPYAGHETGGGSTPLGAVWKVRETFLFLTGRLFCEIFAV